MKCSVRIIASVLTAVMAISMTACSGVSKGGSETTSKTTSKVTDPMAKYSPEITLTTARSISDVMQKYIDKTPDIMTNNIWYNGYKTDLGINVNNVWTVPSAQYDQKLNTQIAANDLPDLIQCNATQLKMLVDNGIATDLTQIFKQYATPFTNDMMKADNNVALNQATFNGKLRALPNVTGNRDNATMWWIRKDWLKNANLSEPKTMDDIIKIATAFAKNDPDKDGKADTYGLGLLKDIFGTEAGLDAFFEGYHAYYAGWIKDPSGKLVFGSIQPEVKTALAKAAELYKDGVIDTEFAVKDSSKVSEDIIAGKIGLFSGQHWEAFYPLLNSKKKDAKAGWQAYPIVSCDDKPATTMIGGSASVYYVVNNKAKNPEAAVKLYNYFYDKDPALSPKFDEKYHGHLENDPTSTPTNCYWWTAMQTCYPEQNLFIHQQVSKYIKTKDESILKNFWVKDNYTQVEKYLKDGDMSGYSASIWAGTNGSEGAVDYYDKNNLFLQNGYIGADTDSMTQYNTTLNQMRLTTFTKIIMGKSPISEFDDYVTQWHKLGGDSITKEVNQSK